MILVVGSRTSGKGQYAHRWSTILPIEFLAYVYHEYWAANARDSCNRHDRRYAPGDVERPILDSRRVKPWARSQWTRRQMTVRK